VTQAITVGQPFPGPVPQADGVTFEIGPDGDMVLLIQMQHPSAAEAKALKAGVERYSLYVQTEPPHVCVWVWKFPTPVKYVDSPFHAGLYQDGRVPKMLALQGNALQVYVLDGNIVKIIRLMGLDHQAAADFRAVVQRQLSQDFTRTAYDRAIDDIYRLSSEEIFRRGKQYRHGGTT
jgi:hypothetical protein